MKRSGVNIGFVLATALALFAVYQLAPRGFYTFGGHGHSLAVGSKALVGLLCLTHAILAGIMWVQRTAWDDAEASSFRFVSVKAIFWGFFFFTVPIQPGITLTGVLLSVAILYTAVDLNLSLLRRYVFTQSPHD